MGQGPPSEPMFRAGRAIGPSWRKGLGSGMVSLAGYCARRHGRRRIPFWETPTPAQSRCRSEPCRFFMLGRKRVRVGAALFFQLTLELFQTVNVRLLEAQDTPFQVV